MICSLARSIVSEGQEACTHFEKVEESSVEMKGASRAELANSNLPVEIRQGK